MSGRNSTATGTTRPAPTVTVHPTLEELNAAHQAAQHAQLVRAGILGSSTSQSSGDAYHGGQAPQAPAGRPGIGVGVALGLGAGALAAGATASWLQSQEQAQAIYPDDLKGDELATAVAEGAQSAQISAALTVSSIACGVGSVLSFVLAARMPPKGRIATFLPPVLVAGPGSVGLAWGMTW